MNTLWLERFAQLFSSSEIISRVVKYGKANPRHFTMHNAQNKNTSSQKENESRSHSSCNYK